eukprot:731064_1
MDPYLQAYSNNASAGAGYAHAAAVGPPSTISKRGRVITTTSITSASANNKGEYACDRRGPSSSSQSQKKSKSLLTIWKNISNKQKKKRSQQNYQRRRYAAPVPVGGNGAPC